MHASKHCLIVDNTTQLVKRGGFGGFFEPNVGGNSLLDMDAKCRWIAEATRVFNCFLVNYVAIFFVIVDCFVYCLWPLYVNTNGGYFCG